MQVDKPNNSNDHSSDDAFLGRLAKYKKAIDDNIDKYVIEILAKTKNDHGRAPYLIMKVGMDILERGGKRMRGALVILGYEMFGGKNNKMILEVARAIEMLHAYSLIIDDIQDRSSLRRGDLTAHKMLTKYHKNNGLIGDSDHFGISMALNSAHILAHQANIAIANINADYNLRSEVASIINQCLVTTTHGQTLDIMNEAVGEVSMDEVYKMMELKTANYTILNPLQVGMVLAGANKKDMDAIKSYAMHTGIAFQITDDIIGVFGNKKNNGKDPMDDIREGKRTLIMIYAIEHTNQVDKNFLLKTLSSRSLTTPDFLRCKQILTRCGAKKYAEQEAEKHIKIAIKSLTKGAKYWAKDDIEFLKSLATFIITRNS